MDGLLSTNPIAVGDVVEVYIDEEHESSAIITNISDRHNYIARSSPHHKKQHHIIASNIDQALLFATLREPRTSLGFIDRFLLTAEAYHIPAIIVFNKADVYRQKEMKKFEELKPMYEKIGYKIFLCSMVEGKGAKEIEQALQDKTTLLCGHSGVGKSTFINYLFPSLNLKTTEVSKWSGKGMHTTTFAEMFDLPKPHKGRIIDTPGIKEFGIIDITKQELCHYFPEMRDRLNDCQFNNCLHYEEPNCAIKEAVSTGEISEERYVSYLTILETIENKTF